MSKEIDAFVQIIKKQRITDEHKQEYDDAIKKLDGALQIYADAKNAGQVKKTLKSIIKNLDNISNLSKLSNEGGPNTEENLQKLFQRVLELHGVAKRAEVLPKLQDALAKWCSQGLEKAAARQQSSKQNVKKTFQYKDIETYRNTEQRRQIEALRGDHLINDGSNFATLQEIQCRGLLDKNLYTREGIFSYDGFYNDIVAPGEHRLISILGELGVGKSQLIQYLICEKISQDKDNTILFIGQRASSCTPIGKQLLIAFRDSKFTISSKTRGRFYIVVDEPDADPVASKWKDNDWVKLYRVHVRFVMVRLNQYLMIKTPVVNI